MVLRWDITNHMGHNAAVVVILRPLAFGKMVVEVLKRAGTWQVSSDQLKKPVNTGDS